MLFVDWFGRLAVEAGFNLTQHGAGGNAFTLGSPTSYNIRAEFIPDDPYLRFIPSEDTHDDVLPELIAKAATRVEARDFGGKVWYAARLTEVPFSIVTPEFMGTLLQRLGSQTRIAGWRRLGQSVLLEFTEIEPVGKDLDQAQLLAPEAMVNAYVAAPGPSPGHFAALIAHRTIETVASICTFALGRPVRLPHVVFPAKPDALEDIGDRSTDAQVLTLDRKGVSLNILGWTAHEGGFPIFQRLRSSLLTFDAAMKQDHDAIASILYVVAAECLTTPNSSWRAGKLTKRFVEFYEELMPNAIDEIVAHGNFEDAIGVRRGSRTPRSLRRETLSRIYSFRSGQLHEGLKPSYSGLTVVSSAHLRRGLFGDFAEAAILHFSAKPRSSLIGHPCSGDVATES